MDRLNWILAGIVVAIGGFGAWYVRLRLNFIAARLAELRAETGAARKQTEEMLRRQEEMLRHQAEASKQAAATLVTLIKSDRSWVVITTIYTAPLAATVSAGAMNNAFRFAIANRGKSVAKIIEIRGEAMIVDRDSIVPEFPPYRAPVDDAASTASVLVPGESFENISIDIDQAIDERKLRDIISGKQRLYFYGFIRYFDFANEERRNQFCYQYVPGSTEAKERWTAGAVGFPRYNSHT
jgi:hypothetical protein